MTGRATYESAGDDTPPQGIPATEPGAGRGSAEDDADGLPGPDGGGERDGAALAGSSASGSQTAVLSPGGGAATAADIALEDDMPTDPGRGLWVRRGRRRQDADLAGWAFAAVTVAPVLLLLPWLVTGVALLLARRFLPVPMLLIAAPAAVALVMFAAGRAVPGGWGGTGLGEWAGRSARRPWVIWLGLAGTVAIAVGFGVWQGLLASPQLIVDRGPGAVAQTAFWIAEYGSLPITHSFAAFGGAHPGLSLASFGFAGQGAVLTPQTAPGLPIALSAGLWAHGLPGAALVSPILGAVAVLAVGGLAGRLAGPAWAPAGSLLLALTLPQIYASRSAFPELLAQALLFGGLCLAADALGGRQSRLLAAVAGVTLGLTTLAGPDFIVALLPAIPFLGVLTVARRPQAAAFGISLLTAMGCGLIADMVLTGPATAGTALRPWAFAIIAFAGATALGLALAVAGPVRRVARKWAAARPLRWLPELLAVVIAAMVVAFAIRPYLQTVRGPANAYVAALQRLAYLRPDAGRLYAEDSLYWVVWYVGAPALVLGAAGLALLARRCLRGLLTWRDPDGLGWAWALPLALVVWGIASVLWRPGTAPDQPWASRVLIPMVLPGLVVSAVWTVAWLIARARGRGAGLPAAVAAVSCFLLALAGPMAVTTFGAGARWAGQPGLGPQRGGVAFQRTGAGEEAALRRLCSELPANATVLLVDAAAGRRFAQPVRGMCGLPVGVMAGASPAGVMDVVSGIERAGRRPVLLASRPAELAAYAGRPAKALDLRTRQDAHVLTQPPASSWPVHYLLWMSEPGGPGAAAGA